jgi:hypothetical protein
MKDIFYREWVPAVSLVKILVAFVVLITLSVQLLLVYTSYVFRNPFWIAMPVSVTTFLLFLFWNYRGIEIELDDKELLVNYGIFNRKSISLKDILSCELTNASFRRYGGVGVRMGWDGSRAYTTSFGDAVRLTTQKGRPFVFSSHNPEEICKIINQMKKCAHMNLKKGICGTNIK